MYCRSMPLDRIQSALQRIHAAYCLAMQVTIVEDRAPWSKQVGSAIKEVTLSKDQQAAMDFFKRAMSVDNTEDHQTINRKLYIVGEPGAGKTEVFIQFCSYAIANNLRVLILCPTGQLVHSYRQRLPETERIRVDTIHAGLRIRRGEEKLVQHAPPMQLRYFDAIFIDEASQIDDNTSDLLDYAVHELPHNPFIAVSADYKQLQPVGDSGMRCKTER